MLAIILAAVFLLVFPIWDMVELRNLKRGPDRKLGYYWRAIMLLWAAAILVGWYFGSTAFGRAPVYFVNWSGGVAGPLSILFSLVLLAALVLPLCNAFRREHLRLAMIKGADAVAFLLPDTRFELFTFAFVSVTAGVCEE